MRRSCTCFFGVVRHSEPTVISHGVHARSAANDFWGKTYLKLTGESKMNQQLSILTGCSAGATESFVVVPFELVKIKCVSVASRSAKHVGLIGDPRLQDKLSTYAGPMDVVRKVVQKEGLLGLYAGMEATFWRYATMPVSFIPDVRYYDARAGTSGGMVDTLGVSTKSAPCSPSLRYVQYSHEIKPRRLSLSAADFPGETHE